MSKGSDRRPMDVTQEEYDKNFDRIFNSYAIPDKDDYYFSNDDEHLDIDFYETF